MKTVAFHSPKYPLGTIAAYGPDNKVATKLAVSVFLRPGDMEPIELRRWFSDSGDARNNTTIRAEVAEFLQRHGVKETVRSDRIMGCPHEEGKDYPVGEACPQCPFWRDIDRFTHKPIIRAGTERPKVGRNEPCPCGSGKKFKKCCGQ